MSAGDLVKTREGYFGVIISISLMRTRPKIVVLLGNGMKVVLPVDDLEVLLLPGSEASQSFYEMVVAFQSCLRSHQ